MIASLAEYLRYAQRQMGKSSVSTAAVIITLALGVGLNPTIFGFLNALLFRPPANAKPPSRLAKLWGHNRRASGIEAYVGFMYPDHIYYRDHNHSFHGMLGFDERLCGTPMAVDTRNLVAATEICRAAVMMLRDWPSPPREALRNMVATGADDPAILKFSTVFGKLCSRLFQNLPRKEFGFLFEVFETVVIENRKGLLRASHHRPRNFSAAVPQTSYWVSLIDAGRRVWVSKRRNPRFHSPQGSQKCFCRDTFGTDRDPCACQP